MLVQILDIVIAGLLLGGIYALIAVGLSLQYGTAKVLNIAHGEFIMVGSFITWWLFTSYNVNPLLCIVITGGFLFIIGYLLYIGLFTTLRKKSPVPEAFEGNSMLATFGLMFIVQNIVLLIWSAEVRKFTFMSDAVSIGGAVFGLNRLIAMGFAIAIAVIFYLFLAYTRLGKAIRAAAQDTNTAGIMGVNINQVLAICFGLGAGMAGIAGTLISICYPIYGTMGVEYLTIALIVVVLGGLGSIVGSFIGGIILGLVGSIVTYFDPSLSLAAYYLIFVILLIVRPTGIMGR
jgi:branched-chain amino acid transport system permease protein